jgi:hypothetical protein
MRCGAQVPCGLPSQLLRLQRTQAQTQTTRSEFAVVAEAVTLPASSLRRLSGNNNSRVEVRTEAGWTLTF